MLKQSLMFLLLQALFHCFSVSISGLAASPQIKGKSSLAHKKNRKLCSPSCYCHATDLLLSSKYGIPIDSCQIWVRRNWFPSSELRHDLSLQGLQKCYFFMYIYNNLYIETNCCRLPKVSLLCHNRVTHCGKIWLLLEKQQPQLWVTAVEEAHATGTLAGLLHLLLRSCWCQFAPSFLHTFPTFLYREAVYTPHTAIVQAVKSFPEMSRAIPVMYQHSHTEVSLNLWSLFYCLRSCREATLHYCLL